MADETPLSLEDYDAIADAVQETERGRWFLAEFARRNRAADTAAVLDALAGLERRIDLQQVAPPRIAGLVHEALDLALLARAAEAGEATQRLDELERTLRLAAAELGAVHKEPLLFVTVEEALIEPPAPLALAPPSERDAALAKSVDPEPPAVAVVGLELDPEPIAAPSIAPEEQHEEQQPGNEIDGDEPEASQPISLFDARPLLLDSLSEAEKAILFA